MDALDLLASNNYITVNKTLIKEIGLENAIIFGLLCGYQRGYGSEEFYKEQEKIIEDSCLSEYLVRKSIKELKEMKYIFVEKKGMPAKYYYKINLDLLSFKLEKSSGVKSDTTGGLEFKAQNKNNNKNEYNNINNNINTKKEIEKEKPVIKDGYSMTDEEIDDIFGITHEEENKLEEKPKTDSEKVFDYYVMKSKFYGYIKRDLKETDVILNNIKKILKEYDLLYIEQTIDRYFQVISDKNYYFDTYWKPELFFKQKNAFLEFTEEGSKWINYNLAKNKVNPYKS